MMARRTPLAAGYDALFVSAKLLADPTGRIKQLPECDSSSGHGSVLWAYVQWTVDHHDLEIRMIPRRAFLASGLLALTACRTTEGALARGEEQLLAAMPLISASFDGWAWFEAPYLRRMRSNPFGCPRFKYVWVDAQWRQQ